MGKVKEHHALCVEITVEAGTDFSYKGVWNKKLFLQHAAFLVQHQYTWVPEHYRCRNWFKRVYQRVSTKLKICTSTLLIPSGMLEKVSVGYPPKYQHRNSLICIYNAIAKPARYIQRHAYVTQRHA